MANPNVPLFPYSYSPACRICRLPVDLKTSNTDEEGQAVHQQCYSRRLCSPPQPPGEKKPPSADWFVR
jgi:hypothetical protein